MRISFFEIQGWEKSLLHSRLKEHNLIFHKDPLTISNIDAAIDSDIISVFIYSRMNQEIIEKLPKLKLISTRSTGFDHIDIKTTTAKNITVCNVPFYGENTVAEHTFALILSLTRNVHKSYVRTTHNDFTIDGLKGFDIQGKLLGVIGAGHIGLHVIRIAKGFGMHVLAFDPNPNTFLAETLHFQYTDSLEEVLSNADIITLHLPLVEGTRHIINKDNIRLIKKGALLINTARGELVDTNALIMALDEGRIAGAGLDVLEGECLIKEEKQLLYDTQTSEVLKTLVQDHILLSKENVVYTPHIAFYSNEALKRILDTTIINIQGFIAGQVKNVAIDITFQKTTV